MYSFQQAGQMGCGRAYAGPSCPRLEVVLLGWECGGGSWLGLGSWWRLALSLALLASMPDRMASARVSSSLSTTHHVHHFHNKHGTVPIAINRMPFLTRGGHGKPSYFPLYRPGCSDPMGLESFDLIKESYYTGKQDVDTAPWYVCACPSFTCYVMCTLWSVP